uniref:Uncharacterized protein n=1 Tax=Glossina palpalis gambiensis TaxID=67801 RepID=A0A1B0AT19_9MUSC
MTESSVKKAIKHLKRRIKALTTNIIIGHSAKRGLSYHKSNHKSICTAVVQEKEAAVIMVILIFGILCTVLMEEDSMADIFCDVKIHV